MNKTVKNFTRGFLVFMAIGVGGYAFSYLNFNPAFGFLNIKADVLKASIFWKLAFYVHVSFGGVALIAGAFQFSEKLRRKLPLHRTLGKFYMIGVAVAGLAGFVLSLFAEGGLIAKTGFNLLAVTWLGTSWLAYRYIRQKNIDLHRQWMIRSYAACCAAISLRIILPLETAALGMDFVTAYQIVAWLCWVPNMLMAEWYVRRERKMVLA